MKRKQAHGYMPDGLGGRPLGQSGLIESPNVGSGTPIERIPGGASNSAVQTPGIIEQFPETQSTGVPTSAVTRNTSAVPGSVPAPGRPTMMASRSVGSGTPVERIPGGALVGRGLGNGDAPGTAQGSSPLSGGALAAPTAAPMTAPMRTGGRSRRSASVLDQRIPSGMNASLPQIMTPGGNATPAGRAAGNAVANPIGAMTGAASNFVAGSPAPGMRPMAAPSALATSLSRGNSADNKEGLGRAQAAGKSLLDERTRSPHGYGSANMKWDE